MGFNIKKLIAAIFISGCALTANAGDVCNIQPGSVTCGKGAVNSLTGNGMVSVNGTQVSGPTIVNGLLSAEDASFSTLNVNGSVNLIQCTVTSDSEIKGSLSASSTRFESKMDVYSSSIRFINSKVLGDLHILHTTPKQQFVYLDNFSEVSGDVIFDDGEGEVVLRGHSKVGGKVIGGQITTK